MKHYIFIFLTLIVSNLIYGQETILLPETAEEVNQLFSKNTPSVSWEIPIGNQKKITLLWHKKENSFSKNEIISFVGYENDIFRGSISIKKGEILGIISLEHKEIHITSEANNQVIAKILQTSTGFCGNCKEGHCHFPNKILFQPKISALSSPAYTPQSSAFTTQILEQISDPVIRIYRLAIPIAYNFYSDTTIFNKNKTRIETFWANTETFLNEIYIRDLSVKFEIVKDNRLIITNENDPLVPSSYKNEAEEIIKNATKTINTLIGNDAYDIGIVISKNSQLTMNQTSAEGLLGLAGVGAVYSSNWKAHAIAIPQVQTIAHEIGHLFGGRHTFSRGDNLGDSVKTEVDSGQSVMSYGSPMNFFSLVSVIQHIKPLLSRTPYYSDENRTQKIGNGFWHNGLFFDNTPRGIRTENKAPILQKSLISQEYSLPVNTFFEFKLSATDPKSQPLYYMAHPADIKEDKNTTITHFLTKMGSEKNTISFQTEFRELPLFFTQNLLQEIPYSTPYQTGDFTFWLGVRNTHQHQTEKNSAYDITQTKVKIKQAKAFAFTNSFKKRYFGNEKIELRWEPATAIFPNNSKVRILLSDDFGKTFKYTLLNETENDGVCQIILPNIKIGTTPIASEYEPGGVVNVPAGVIKIEVINHIAYALSAIRPYNLYLQNTEILGGFTLEKSNIIFKNTPEKEISVACTEIPQKANVIAINEATLQEIPVSFSEEGNLNECKKHSFTRTWTAQSGDVEIAFIQTLHILENSLAFSGILPEDKEINCGDVIPEVIENLPVIGSCEQRTQTFSQTIQKGSCPNNYTIIRQWKVTDQCGKSISHIQKIKVIDTKPPVFISKPNDTTILQEDVESYTPVEPIVTDNCNQENIRLTFNQKRNVNNNNEVTLLTNTWTATDICGNQSEYTQKVWVLPSLKIYNGVSTQTDSKNYFSVENSLENSSIFVTIFNDLGIKVFESKHYENPEIFKGFSNQPLNFIKNKHLPKGTYFYIIKYAGIQNENYTKTGFLLVK